MKKLLIISIITAFISSIGLAQNVNSANKSNSKKVSISGTIVSKNTNELLPNATVNVRKFSTNPIDFRNAPNNVIKTDANGSWKLEGIEAGEYRIVVSPPEKKSGQVNSFGEFAEVTKIVDVSDDLENFVIKLPRESVILGTISVKDDSDDVGDVYIIATDAEQEIVSGTDVIGNKFKIENLSGGNFKLNLHSDKGYFVERINLGNKDISSSTITLKDGEEFGNINIILSKEAGYITGKLKGASERESVMIILLPVKENAEDSLRGSMPVFPDESGVFEFTAPPGEYLIATLKTIDLEKKTDNKKQWFEFLTKNAQKVIVIPAQTTNVNLENKD